MKNTKEEGRKGPSLPSSCLLKFFGEKTRRKQASDVVSGELNMVNHKVANNSELSFRSRGQGESFKSNQEAPDQCQEEKGGADSKCISEIIRQRGGRGRLTGGTVARKIVSLSSKRKGGGGKRNHLLMGKTQKDFGRKWLMENGNRSRGKGPEPPVTCASNTLERPENRGACPRKAEEKV